jgi:hypothetical protein
MRFGLFNSGLESNLLRAIVIHEEDEVDEKAFKSLIRAAAGLNASSALSCPGSLWDSRADSSDLSNPRRRLAL